VVFKAQHLEEKGEDNQDIQIEGVAKLNHNGEVDHIKATIEENNIKKRKKMM
jgi:hypothetical protein